MQPRRPRSNLRRTWPSSPLLPLQLQGSRVDAVALPGWVRPVGKDVAKVSAAVRAHDLGADHAVARVRLFLNCFLACGRVERGPAAARVVLRSGDEQLGPAA